MSRKSASISLFICFVAPLVVTFTFLQVQKKLVRKEVKHRMIAAMGMDELVLLKFTEAENQLEWEHSKEFEYQDHMYDVVRKEVKGDTTYFWCWLDEEETVLNKKLNVLVSEILGANPQSEKNQEKFSDFFKKLFCNTGEVRILIQEQVVHHSFEFIEVHKTIYYSPPFPPPRFS